MSVAVLKPLKDFHDKLDGYQCFDFAMRLPIVAYSLLILGWDVRIFCGQVEAHPAIFLDADSGIVVATMARVCQWMFIALLAIFHLIRLRPIAKLAGMLPRAAALIAAAVPPLFVLLDRAPPSLAFNSASALLGLLASIMAVVTLSFLGRSLSVMPEARRLVTNGPYALVRHPLYVCELMGVAAILLQYRSIEALGLFLALAALQVLRARWEEQVLARGLPAFSAYRKRTPFIIPRDPVRFLTVFFADRGMRRRSIMVVAATAALDAVVLLLLPRLIG